MKLNELAVFFMVYITVIICIAIVAQKEPSQPPPEPLCKKPIHSSKNLNNLDESP